MSDINRAEWDRFVEQILPVLEEKQAQLSTRELENNSAEQAQRAADAQQNFSLATRDRQMARLGGNAGSSALGNRVQAQNRLASLRTGGLSTALKNEGYDTVQDQKANTAQGIMGQQSQVTGLGLQSRNAADGMAQQREREYQQARAKRGGAFSSILSTAGMIAGGVFGGPAGAAIGGSLGSAIGGQAGSSW